MSPVSPIVLALGLWMMPVSVAPQTTGEGARSSSASSETTVSVKSLLDAKVLDSTNREMGTVRSLLADPQTGKLVRADIDVKGSSSFGKGSDQQLSVPWEQVSVKRYEGNFVLVLKQEALEKFRASRNRKVRVSRINNPSSELGSGYSLMLVGRAGDSDPVRPASTLLSLKQVNVMNRPKKEISGSVSVSRQHDKEFQLCMAEAIKIVERNCELIEDGQRLLDRWQSIGKLDGHQFADIISEAMETQQQLRTLLEMGEMDKEEAEHAISNAEQVILFAQAAMKRDGN